MAQLKIPEDHKGGVLKLLKLSDESLEQMISALEQVTPHLFPQDLSSEVVSKTKDVSPEDVSEILETLLSLFYSGFHHDLPPEQLADDVVEAMVETPKDFELPSERQKWFRERLIRVFKIENLLVVAKALSVLQDNEKNFYGARILTDIRPVFGSDTGVAPRAAVIVHMLNLIFHSEGKTKELFIAMDTADVQMLREVLDRADVKSETLKSVIEKTGLKYLDPRSRS
jgi:hypothetical protein